MLVVSLTSIFLVLFIIYLSSSYSLLISLVLLEMLSFLVLWVSILVFSSTVGLSISLLFFCLFVLESVLGLVGLLNLIHFSGSDYVSPSVFLF